MFRGVLLKIEMRVKVRILFPKVLLIWSTYHTLATTSSSKLVSNTLTRLDISVLTCHYFVLVNIMWHCVCTFLWMVPGNIMSSLVCSSASRNIRNIHLHIFCLIPKTKISETALEFNPLSICMLHIQLVWPFTSSVKNQPKFSKTKLTDQ